MKVTEMRAFLKERDIRGYSTMKKSKLTEEVQKIQQEDERAKYERQLKENVLCHACLTEQRKQRKIDEKTHDQRLLDLTIRDLVCEYCQHTNLAQEGDDTFCVLCGELQSPDAEGGYRN